MHKNATKCNKTLSKWCENKHGASKIIDMFETYQLCAGSMLQLVQSKALDEAPYKLSRAVAKLAGITF
jgi:hypothetical protein